jgi:hypothetical protein
MYGTLILADIAGMFAGAVLAAGSCCTAAISSAELA